MSSRDSPSRAPAKANPKIMKFATVSGAGGGFRKGSAAAGPSSSNYTEDDVTRNSTEAVLARQGIQADAKPKPTLTKGSDEEFIDAGTREGVEVWRINNLQPVPVPKDDYGKFYTGDSYIVLHTKELKNSFEYHSHFWLGAESTFDETGAAAYKVVELSDKLGGGIPQYREIQGNESERFLSYFPDGVQYLEGGLESAFEHVERKVYTTRLLHLKGRKNVRIRTVPCVRGSLNEGDVFILDAGFTVFVWNGKEASRQEKMKATHVAQNIKDRERGGQARIVLLDEDDVDHAKDWVTFWELLGGKGPVAPAVDDDAQYEVAFGAEDRLYRVSDSSGELTLKQEANPLSRRQLSSMDAFILDAKSEIWVWLGGGCTHLEKQEAMAIAKKYLVKYNRPKHTPIVKVLEGHEPTIFREHFPDWTENYDPSRLKKLALLTKLAEEAAAEDDKDDVHEQIKELQQQKLEDRSDEVVDIGSEQLLDVVLVDGDTLTALTKLGRGQLHDGNAYVVSATHSSNGDKRNTVYLWIGKDAPEADRERASQEADRVAKQLTPVAKVASIPFGKETDAFLVLFRGQCVVNRGEANPRRKFVFTFTGAVPFGHSVVVSGNLPCLGGWQLDRALKLSSDGGIWHGCAVISGSAAQHLEYKYVMLSEIGAGGKATGQPVWESTPNRVLDLAADGFEAHASDKWQSHADSRVEVRARPSAPPGRLYHIRGTNVVNTRAVEVEASARSLNSGDAFLLQTPASLFVWYGKGCNEYERKYSAMLAKLLHLRSGSVSTPVTVEEGSEPADFWTALGGKGEYASSAALAAAKDIPPPRLFHCSNAKGKFHIREVKPFSQADFFEDDVMILDAFNEIFVWFGSGSNDIERRRSMKVAFRFARTASDNRPPDCPVVRVIAGQEPPAFSAHFVAWDTNRVDSYTQRLRQLQAEEFAASQEKKKSIAKTLDYTGENADAAGLGAGAAGAAYAAAKQLAGSGLATGHTGESFSGRSGNESSLANEAAAAVAARQEAGSSSSGERAPDASAASSSYAAERREAEAHEARARANAAVAAAEEAKRAETQGQWARDQAAAKAKLASGLDDASVARAREAQKAAEKRAADETQRKAEEEAAARRKADQDRANQIAAKLKADREAKAKADAEAREREAREPKRGLFDKLAETEADFRVEMVKRANSVVFTSSQRAQSDMRFQPLPSAVSSAAPVATSSPVYTPVPASSGSPTAALGSLFTSAAISIRDVLQTARVRLRGQIYQYVRGRRGAIDCYEVYREHLGRGRRYLSEDVVRVAEATSSSALRGAAEIPADQRPAFGKLLKAFNKLANGIGEEDLKDLETKLLSLREWTSTEDLLVAALIRTVDSATQSIWDALSRFLSSDTLLPSTSLAPLEVPPPPPPADLPAPTQPATTVASTSAPVPPPVAPALAAEPPRKSLFDRLAEREEEVRPDIERRANSATFTSTQRVQTDLAAAARSAPDAASYLGPDVNTPSTTSAVVVEAPRKSLFDRLAEREEEARPEQERRANSATFASLQRVQSDLAAARATTDAPPPYLAAPASHTVSATAIAAENAAAAEAAARAEAERKKQDAERAAAAERERAEQLQNIERERQRQADAERAAEAQRIARIEEERQLRAAQAEQQARQLTQLFTSGAVQARTVLEDAKKLFAQQLDATVKGKAALPSAREEFREAIQRVRRQLSDRFLDLADTIANAVVKGAGDAPADLKSVYGKQLQSFNKLMSAIANDDLPTLIQKLSQAREWGQPEPVLCAALLATVDSSVAGSYNALCKWFGQVPSSSPLPPLGQPVSADLTVSLAPPASVSSAAEAQRTAHIEEERARLAAERARLEARQAQLAKMKSMPALSTPKQASTVSSSNGAGKPVYSYEQLRRDRGGPPAGLDDGKLEQYLSDEEFQQYFKMTRQQFAAKPAWQARQIKLSLKLF